MNHLGDIILGYENEQVLALVKEMEESGAVWNMRNEDGKTYWMTVNEGRSNEIRRMDKMIVICEQLCNIRYNSDAMDEEAVVGFDNEVETLLDQLTGICTKQFQIISITGMAGLGKTTLARTLYNHELVKYMFDFRAWTCVSQVYLKKDLLLNILSSFIDDLTDDFYEMSELQIGEKLYRKLKGRRYLVVSDDIWDCRVWNDLKIYFRTEVESWSIFKKVVFRMGICPCILEIYGRIINEKCEGLPLAVVIAAGLVKNNLSDTWWKQIAASLRSFMVSNPKEYIDSLAVSYNNLPPLLRPCFLFFGAFLEDYEVPVTKLIWLWIAQGFVHERGNRILEDIAEDFLMDLIKRSLVMISKIKADSKVKACRIHDLLRDFCLKKADEENFMSNNYRRHMVSLVHSFPLEVLKFIQEGGSVCIDAYKFLRVLDIESILIPLFPLDVTKMVNLRYLAIQARDGSPHASISNLVNLQMLIISSRKNILVPKTIWNMVNLRHLYIKSGVNIMEDPSFLQVESNDGPIVLATFQTLSQLSTQSCDKIFSRTPNLRKLGFCGPLISCLGNLDFPNLGSLVHLEKLKWLNTFSYPEATRSCNPIIFPKKLKKLTLSHIGIDWDEMWCHTRTCNGKLSKSEHSGS